MTDKEKIAGFLEKKGESKNSFYKKTGLSTGFLDSRKSLGVDKLRLILDNYPDFNTENILGLVTSTSSIRYTLKESKRKSENFENQVREEMGRYDKELANEVMSSSQLVHQKAIAGFGNDSFSIQDKDVKARYVIPAFKHKKVDFMIEIDGSSMYPKYSSGDVVACTILRECRFIQWNKVHVLATKEQGIIIKRVHQGANGNLKMVSDNNNYPPFEVPEEEITGIALVVGVIRLE